MPDSLNDPDTQSLSQKPPEPDQPAADEMKVSFLRTNRGIGIGLLVIVGILAASIYFSDWAGRILRDGFMLGGFPLLATGFMAVASLILVFDGQARQVDPDVARFRLVSLVIVLAAVAVLGVGFLSIPIIGFVPMIFLLVGFGAVTLGYRPVWLAFVVAIIVALVMRTIMYWLDADIDDGLLLKLIMGDGNG